VLLDADDPAHAGAAYWIGSLAEVLQRIPDLYRSGAGLPYPEYGADVRLAIANLNRPMFVNDAALVFEALHDMARPVEVLQAVRGLLAGDGVVIVADEKVAEIPSVAAGTALRPATVRRWAEQAGFAGLGELPVDHLFWRFYELRG
jgi:hypothetical protein